MSNYEKFFEEADKDKSGFLTLNELIGILRSRGYKESDDKIKTFFKAVDMSGDDKISKEEYLQAMGEIPAQNHREASMRQLFREFDKDGSGSIDRKELDAVFKELGKTMPEKDLARIIELADKDKSGTLDYEEFIKQVFGRSS